MNRMSVTHDHAGSAGKPLYVVTQGAHPSAVAGWIPLAATGADRHGLPIGLHMSHSPSLPTLRGEMKAAEARGERLWGLIRGIPGVEALWVDADEDGLDVTVIANNLSWDHERTLFGLYRVWVQQDRGVWPELHVVDRRDDPIEDLCSLDPRTTVFQ